MVMIFLSSCGVFCCLHAAFNSLISAQVLFPVLINFFLISNSDYPFLPLKKRTYLVVLKPALFVLSVTLSDMSLILGWCSAVCQQRNCFVNSVTCVFTRRSEMRKKVLFSPGIFAICARFTSANTLPRSALRGGVLLPPRVPLALRDAGVRGAGDRSSDRLTGSGGLLPNRCFGVAPSEQKRNPNDGLLCRLFARVGDKGNALVLPHGQGGRPKPPEARGVPGGMSPPFAGPAAAEHPAAKPAASPPGRLLTGGDAGW